jgi:hypothetical protein
MYEKKLPLMTEAENNLFTIPIPKIGSVSESDVLCLLFLPTPSSLQDFKFLQDVIHTISSMCLP